MGTGTAGNAARKYTTHQLHYAAVDFTYLDDGRALSMGFLPPGASVVRRGVNVSVAFNAGSTNVLDIGTTEDPDGLAGDLALGTVGVITAGSELATSNDAGPLAAATEFFATVDLSGTAPETGKGRAWIEYMIQDQRSSNAENYND